MDNEEQAEELVVLSSIYEEYFHEFSTSESKGGEMIIHLNLPDPILLVSNNGKQDKCNNYSVD